MNHIKYYDSCLYILDEKQDHWKIKNLDVLSKVWKLVDKLLEKNSSKMPLINAFYDVTQDVLTIILGKTR